MGTHAVEKGKAGAYLARRPRIKVLDVDYLHLQMEDGSDLYITEYGLPFVSQLLPDNYWTDKDWFARNSTKLDGTSMCYKIRTKEMAGASKDIVLKWNRMGQDIPGETQASELSNAEFNSPFEEFSLVIELRNTPAENPNQCRIHTPLAIYVPRKYVEMDRLGRHRYKIEAIQRNHQELMLDPHRQYAVLYEWIEGIDSLQARNAGIIDNATMRDLLVESDRELERKGYRVNDSKPNHVIVTPTDAGGLETDEHGDVRYSLIDFELLERTPQREQEVRDSRRKSYLIKQAHRFEGTGQFPEGLAPVNIMGVDYVFGQVESTGGALWVVGKDPVLFEYFLPVKWRKTARKRLSVLNQVYETASKDNIHLVWRVSRVGERPDFDPFLANEARILSHGYNSPFEEIALSIELAAKGIETTYPRAIYRSGHKSEVPDLPFDTSRYESHASLKTQDGHPILGEHHDYIMLWGYWNGPDELLAMEDVEYFHGIDALRAYRDGLIDKAAYLRTMETTRERLAAAGIEDMDLRGNHLLLSLDRSDRLVIDDKGMPAVRICNFELMRRIQGD